MKNRTAMKNRIAIPQVILLSAAAFAAAILLPAGSQGQPQGKDKAKKAGKTAIRTTVIAGGLWHPWSLAWLPNGDMLVTERNGKLRVWCA